MEELIERLYNAHIREEAFPFGKNNLLKQSKEFAVYKYLKENLPEGYQKIFIDYIKAKEEREDSQLRYAYEQGFKAAVCLFVNSLKQ